MREQKSRNIYETDMVWIQWQSKVEILRFEQLVCFLLEKIDLWSMGFHMVDPVANGNKGFVTQRTFVRSLPGMNSGVIN